MNCRPVTQPTPMWPFRQEALPGLAMFALPLDGYEPPCDAVLMDSRWLGQALPLRRREFAGGRVCAAAALTALGLLDDWLPIARPYRYALFPPGAVGSIAHNRSLALACAADADCFIGVGIDIEEVVWHPELVEMAAHVMHPDEHQRFERMEGLQALQFFYLCFSAKESLYKALFPLCHVDLEMSEAELVSWDAQGRFVLALRSERLGERFADGHDFHGFWATQEGTLFTMIPLEQTTSTASNRLYACG